jgi:hypothetical protein
LPRRALVDVALFGFSLTVVASADISARALLEDKGGFELDIVYFLCDR